MSEPITKMSEEEVRRETDKNGDSFYDDIGLNALEKDIIISEENAVIPTDISFHESYFEETLNNNSIRFYYISDIHIDYKLKKRFPEHASKEEIADFIKDLVEH